MDTMAFLQKVPIFAKLSKQALWRLSGLAHTVSFNAGDTIMQEGDEGDSCYIIVNGEVEVSKATQTELPKIVAKLGTGEIIGEMAVIDNEPRSATVKALQVTECLMIKQWDFMAQMQAYPEIALQLVPVLVRRLRKMQKNQ